MCLPVPAFTSRIRKRVSAICVRVCLTDLLLGGEHTAAVRPEKTLSGNTPFEESYRAALSRALVATKHPADIRHPALPRAELRRGELAPMPAESDHQGSVSLRLFSFLLPASADFLDLSCRSVAFLFSEARKRSSSSR